MQINKKFFYIGTVVSFIFFVLACYFTNIVIFPPESLYLFENLNFCYWIGLAILALVISFRIYYPVRSTVLDIFIIFLAILYSDVAQFIYIAIRYMDSYLLYWNLIEPGIRLGTFNSELITYSQPSVYQYTYNTSTILFAYLIEICNHPYAVFNIFPVYTHYFGALFIYAIGRFYSKEYAFVGGVAFAPFNWLSDHISPQEYAYLLIFSLVFVLYKYFQTNEKRYVGIVILFVCIIAISHMLSNLIILGLLLLLLITIISGILLNKYKIVQFDINLFNLKTQIQPLFIILIISSLSYLSYAIFSSRYLFQKTVGFSTNYIENGLNIESISLTHRTISESHPPSASYLISYDIRMLSLSAFMIIGIICILFILYSFRFDKKSEVSQKKMLCFFILFFVFPVSFTVLFLLMGNSEYGFERPYSIALFALCVMLVFFISCEGIKKLITARKTLMIILIIGLMILNPINKFASDPYQFYSESHDQATIFTKSIYVDPYMVSNGDLILYTNLEYDYAELKSQTGSRYANGFSSLNKIYDVGRSASEYVYT
jgi:hypothetical protein